MINLNTGVTLKGVEVTTFFQLFYVLNCFPEIILFLYALYLLTYAFN